MSDKERSESPADIQHMPYVTSGKQLSKPTTRRAGSRHVFRTAGSPGSQPSDNGQFMCMEVTKGHKRVYRSANEAFDVTDDKVSGLKHVQQLFQSYLLPQGFPDSVAPEYSRYMTWRGCQYFFGGAISVLTTRSLLGALGVAGRRSGESAAAINWVVKDGAGRFGRFLFARWGRDLDCELKQFRLMGGVLLEASAALELSTIALPTAFLPLACTANLAKNLAAVAASSTRAPIYKTFALQNNLADVTAKGESVANLADIGGTVTGIVLSRTTAAMLPVFCVLSAGYLFASRKEVGSVQLPYLNRARLAFAARSYLATGVVPSVMLANHHEPLLPWGPYGQGRVVLGARVEDACLGPSEYANALETFGTAAYALTYRPETDKAYVILRQGATVQDTLCGAFHAHVLLHMLDAAQDKPALPALQLLPKAEPGTNIQSLMSGLRGVGDIDEPHEHLLHVTATKGYQLYQDFVRKASNLGWNLDSTMLNPQESRLIAAERA